MSPGTVVAAAPQALASSTASCQALPFQQAGDQPRRKGVACAHRVDHPLHGEARHLVRLIAVDDQSPPGARLDDHRLGAEGTEPPRRLERVGFAGQKLGFIGPRKDHVGLPGKSEERPLGFVRGPKLQPQIGIKDKGHARLFRDLDRVRKAFPGRYR